MKLICRWTATLGLALSTLAAQAVQVSITSQSPAIAPLLSGPGAVSFQFDVPDPIVGAIPQGSAFSLNDLSINASFGGSSFASLANTVGWFDYPGDLTYRGVDVRLFNAIAPNDVVQLIVSFNEAPFTGSGSNPSLELLNLSNLGGQLYYYPNGFLGGTSATSFLSSTSYSVSAVPEPSTWALLLVGFAAVGLGSRFKGASTA